MMSVRDRLAAKLAVRANAPQFEKWSELPKEVKKKCIGKLDLKTRFCLRAASKTDKKLVESTDLHIYLLLVDGSRAALTVRYVDDDGNVRKLILTSGLQVLHNLVYTVGYFMKHAIIEEFELYYVNSLEQIEQQIIDKTVSQKFTKVTEFYSNMFNELTLFFLGKMWTKMRYMRIVVDAGDRYSFNEIAKIPSFDYVQFFKTINCNPSKLCAVRLYFPLIQNWIENNMPIGKKLVAEKVKENSFALFIDRFKSLLISQVQCERASGAIARIGTNNPSKHIAGCVLERQGEYTFVCAVIPAECQASAYRKYLQTTLNYY